MRVAARSRAEDGLTDADDLRALFDRDLEIARHAHRLLGGVRIDVDSLIAQRTQQSEYASSQPQAPQTGSPTRDSPAIA